VLPAFIDQRLVGLALGPGLRQFLARGSGHEDVGDEALIDRAEHGDDVTGVHDVLPVETSSR
jgi:hypothetical protein